MKQQDIMTRTRCEREAGVLDTVVAIIVTAVKKPSKRTASRKANGIGTRSPGSR
jgi:hypothetical protein